MTIKNIYGTYMDTDKPVTGVTNGNHVPDWFNDEFYNAIDLNFIEFERELLEQLEQGLIDDDTFQYERDCYEPYCTTYLLGDWLIDDDGKYYPDPDGEYSAIYDNNDNIIQVVLSKTTKRCNHCSPCYPNQVDLDSDGEFLGYCLPN